MITVKGILKILKDEGMFTLIRKIHDYFCNKEKKEYYQWIKFNTPSKRELSMQKKYTFRLRPKISIIIPLYNTPKQFLLELIKSVQNQTYSNWELCLADGSTKPLSFLKKIIKKDSRIKYTILKENKGISGNTNEALKLATGDFIGLLDHDDIIPPNSLFEIVKTINENEDVEYIFTDEDKFTDIRKKTRYEPNFKPDYSFDTLTSYNYICHFSVFKKDLMDRLEGFKEEFNGSQDYDLILRAVENSKKTIHIPKILYHWRVHPNSTAGNAESKPYCYEAGKNAVQEHLKRKGYSQAKVEYGVAIVRNRVLYAVKEESKVNLILYLQDNRLNLEDLNENINKITYNNCEIFLLNTKEISTLKKYSKLKTNNKIKNVKQIDKENVVNEINKIIREIESKTIIIAKDIQNIKTNDFIEQMLGFVQRGNVGVISPRIIYKNLSLQYNGTVYGIDKDKTGYLDYLDTAGSFGYITRGAVVENYSIIKSECIMVSKENLEKVNYLDEEMDYEDAFANLAFELFKNHNLLNIINPHIELETLDLTKKSGENNFYKKWKEYLKVPDPNYNINLKFEKNNLFKIKQEKVGK